MYKEKKRKCRKGKAKVEVNVAAPFQVSPMSSAHDIGTKKSVIKTVGFVESKAPLTVKIITSSKIPKAHLVIVTKTAPKATSGALVKNTEKPGKSVMAIGHSHGDFVIPGNGGQPPIKFYGMRNPLLLNLQKNLPPQEEIQYYRYSLVAQNIMILMNCKQPSDDRHAWEPRSVLQTASISGSSSESSGNDGEEPPSMSDMELKP